MENKVFRVLIIILNTIGVLCLLYFGYLYLSHDTFVPNPEAMLPMERWDGGGWVLTIGLLPLFIANALGFIAFRDRRTAARFLWFVPGIVCLVLVISYWIYSLAG
jgi:hypothetical protein